MATVPALQRVAAADFPLVGRSVLLFANRLQRAVALDEAAVARGIGRLEAEGDERNAVAQTVAQRFQRIGGHQGCVGVMHDHIAGGGFQRGARREHGVRGPASFGLDENLCAGENAPRGLRQRFAGGARADHHCDAAAARLDKRIQRMRQHRPPGDFVQRLRLGRAHARAFAGRQQHPETGAFRIQGRTPSISNRP